MKKGGMRMGFCMLLIVGRVLLGGWDLRKSFKLYLLWERYGEFGRLGRTQNVGNESSGKRE